MTVLNPDCGTDRYRLLGNDEPTDGSTMKQLTVTEAPPEQLAEAVTQTRYGPVDITYDVRGNPEDPALLLIAGLGTQMIYWDEGFCETMVRRGYYVIRMDNRDCGRSTVLYDADVPHLVPMMLGVPARVRYRLSDMAQDSVNLLDHLGIEKAHVAGFSMGGMIVQTIAVEHPDRVLSLCSIMSRTGAFMDSLPPPKHIAAMMRPVAKTYDAYIERTREMIPLLGSPAYPTDEERLLALADRAWERGIHRQGTARQLHAINVQPNREKALGRLEIPAVVLHGSADRLVPLRGGKATADAIPGARFRVFKGMGHDLPQELWPLFAAEIDANANRTL